MISKVTIKDQRSVKAQFIIILTSRYHSSSITFDTMKTNCIYAYICIELRIQLNTNLFCKAFLSTVPYL